MRNQIRGLGDIWSYNEGVDWYLTDKLVPKKEKEHAHDWRSSEASPFSGKRRKSENVTEHLQTGCDLDYAEFTQTRNALLNMTRSLKRSFEKNLSYKVKKNQRILAWYKALCKLQSENKPRNWGSEKLPWLGGSNVQGEGRSTKCSFCKCIHTWRSFLVPEPDVYEDELLEDIVYPERSENSCRLSIWTSSQVLMECTPHCWMCFLSCLFRSFDEGKLPAI